MQGIYQVIVFAQMNIDDAIKEANPRISDQAIEVLRKSMWRLARLNASIQGLRNPKELQVTPATVPARGPVGNESIDEYNLTRMKLAVGEAPLAKDEAEITQKAEQFVTGVATAPGESTPVDCRIYNPQLKDRPFCLRCEKEGGF